MATKRKRPAKSARGKQAHGRPPKYTATEMAEAVRKSAGVQTVAAQLLKCDRKTVASYLEKHKTVKDAAAKGREEFIDEAEFQLRKLVREGMPSAVYYTLNNLGRGRGYGNPLLVNASMQQSGENIAKDIQKFLKAARATFPGRTDNSVDASQEP